VPATSGTVLPALASGRNADKVGDTQRVVPDF
jgi:hypothetical protein